MRIDTAHSRGTKIIGCIVVLALIVALACSGIPQVVASKLFDRQTFTNSEVAIVAQVSTDSSLSVVDQRTLQFTDKTTCIKWTCNSAGSSGTVGVTGVRISHLDANGESVGTTELALESFESAWASTNCSDGVGPGAGKYAVDHQTNTVYLFVDESEGSAVISLEYTASLAAVPWRDVGELDWTFFSSTWPTDANNVHVSVHVPAPANVGVIAGDNVNAWSHAPEGSVVQVDSSGFVTFEAARVGEGQSCGLHVTFPSSWLTSMPRAKETTQHENDMRLESVKASEQKWADTWSAGWVRGNMVDICLLAICALFLLVSLVVYLVFGRDHKPRFTDPLLRHKPDCDLHPAIVGRLWRWNRESNDELVATIMRLVSRGRVKIALESGEFRMTLCGEVGDSGCADAAARIDTAAEELLFKVLSEGSQSVALKDVKTFACARSDDYKTALVDWQRTVTEETDKHGFFESRGFKLQVRMLVAAFLLLVVGIGVKLAIGSDMLLLPAIPTAVLMAFLANYLPRRTQKGQDLVAQCKALATWMEQLPNSGELLGQTREECDELMIYAQLFGTVEFACGGSALKATGKSAYDCPCCAWHAALREAFKE